MTDDVEQQFADGFLTFNEDVEQKYIWENKHGATIKAFLEWSKEKKGYQFRTLAMHGGLEFVFATENVFEGFGIQGSDLASCVDGNLAAIRRVSRKILKHMDEVRDRIDAGETHLVGRKLELSRSAISMFIIAAFDGMERYDTYQPIPELHYLLKEILVPGVPSLEKTRQAREQRIHIIFFAAELYRGSRKIPSMRKIAKLLGLSPSTVSRHFRDTEEYSFEVERWRDKLKTSSIDTLLNEDILRDSVDDD